MAQKDAPLKIIPFRPDETPTVCIEINMHWIPFLIAAVYPSRYPEAWLGTLEENKQARQDVLELIRLFMEAFDCGMSSDCCPENLTIIIQHQLAADQSSMEMSIDGGQTWLPDSTDPRAQIPETPAPVGSVVATKCDAAENIVQGLQEAQVIISNTASGEGSLQEIALEVITAILAFLLLPPAGAAILLTVVIGLVRHFLALGKANYDALFTSEHWDIVRCAFFCALDDNGKLSAAGMNGAKIYIYQHMPGDNHPNGAAQNHVDLINFVGLAGLNLIAYTYQSSGANCSACECDTCEHDLDFKTEPFYWLADDIKGSWVSGSGWKSSYKTVDGGGTHYIAQYEMIFATPCTAESVHLEWTIADWLSGQAHAYFHKLTQVGNELVWDGGYNISPGLGNHSEGFVFASAENPVYGIRFGVVNDIVKVDHFLERITIPAP